MGIGRQPCRRLNALNVAECPLLGDAALSALGAGGCRALSYINLTACELVTDAGVVALTKGCPKLKVAATRSISLAPCDCKPNWS